MDFSLTNGMDAVRSGAAAFDLGEETEFGEKLTDKLTAMYETAMGLYGESGKNLLADGGYTPAHYPYSAKDVRDTYTAIFAERGCEAPAVVRIYRSDANAEHFLAFGTALDGTEITAETLNGAMDGLIFENGRGVQHRYRRQGRPHQSRSQRRFRRAGALSRHERRVLPRRRHRQHAARRL